MIPRLFIDAPLATDMDISLSTEQAHYLRNVLRRAPGDPIALFNGVDGEFAAELIAVDKKAARVRLAAQSRPQQNEPDVRLLFAPVKRGPMEVIVQKAVELGAAQLTPVITERSIASKLNISRLQMIAQEASEQCGRLSVPSIDAPVKLAALIAQWDEARRIMFCDEAGDNENQEWGGRDGRAAPALEALNADVSGANSWAVLIGPEGGFSAGERQALRNQSFVTPVTLGPRILRADSAAIAALTLWQAVLGDWRNS